MFRQVGDLSGQDRDLYFRRTGVSLVDPVGVDSLSFNFSGQWHAD
jgi:hypothetical protein